MRDAFGGVFMMRLLLVFIVILVAFTAISFKYAKSFRIKNKVIDFIEQNQVIDIDSFFNQGSKTNVNKLDEIIASAEYDVSCNDTPYQEGNIYDKDTNKVIGYCHNGIVIIKNFNKSKDDSSYNVKTIDYDVYTYAHWNLGILNTLLTLGGENPNSEKPLGGFWEISGEAIVKY